jgi:hypothetical protein
MQICLHITNDECRIGKNGLRKEEKKSMVHGLSTIDNGPSTIDHGLWTMDYRPWTMDYGLWTMDY